MSAQHKAPRLCCQCERPLSVREKRHAGGWTCFACIKRMLAEIRWQHKLEWLTRRPQACFVVTGLTA